MLIHERCGVKCRASPPVAGAPAVVRNRNDRNAAPQNYEHHVIGKVEDWKPAHSRIVAARYETSGREPFNVIERGLDRGSELFRDSGVAFAVPRDRFSKIAARARPEESAVQRGSSSRRKSASATRQSSSSSGLSIASWTRLLISAAHAA